MASPFKFFRKHQTELLVVIGLLTMVAFIILPSILQQLEVVGRSRTMSNVVETKKYGALSTYDVQRLKERQRVLMGFFNRVSQAYQAKFAELYQNLNEEQQRQTIQMFSNQVYHTSDPAVAEVINLSKYSSNVQSLAEQLGDSSDQTVVLMWLFENKAKEMGLSINDAVISSFISENTRGLDENTINFLIYGDETKRDSSAEDALFDALSGYLLRVKMIQILGSSWSVNTTGEDIDSFCRMNQRANVEFFPVKVEDFISKTGEPTDAEIRTFFETYKDKDADIASSEPGLRQPQKIVLEYCYGSYAQFMDPEAITDEQVQKNYEENKENYVIEKKDEKQENVIGELPDLGIKGVNGKEYRPLDDTLKEEIRQSLARIAATEKLQNAIGIVQKTMNDYSVAKDMFEMKYTEEDRKREDIKKQAPAAIDFPTLAKDNKLEYVNTGLITLQSFMDSPLAQLRLKDISTNSVDAASEFFGKTPLLQSKVFENPDGEIFVVWKSDDVAEHTPKFDEDGIKKQVIDQIKFIEARKLAQDEAKQCVEKAAKDQRPLKSCLGDAAFVPPQFTWMTFGPIFTPNMQPRVYLSPIEGVQDAGFDFMAALFQMKEGEITSIVNSSESVYYVVRMIELTPTNLLYSRFCVTPQVEYLQARMPDSRFFYTDLREKLENEAGLKWVVRPDANVERE